MKILVTGAKGMLGQDLCPVLEDSGFDVIETDIESMDITDLKSVENTLKQNNPDYIIHCAAYTNVDKAEEEQEIAFNINAKGTKNIAQIAKELNITVVYISTDYVFDGTKSGNYIPTDKPNPINIYGKSKLAGEEEVKKCEKYYITRTSWLYGHHGKNFVETMLSLKDKEEIKVVNDQKGCPTWTVELSNAICNLIEQEMPYGIYHLCGSGNTTWYGFAKKIFEFSNLKVNLKPCTSKEYKTKAKRPENSVMDNNKSCRSWETALKEYLELRCE